MLYLPITFSPAGRKRAISTLCGFLCFASLPGFLYSQHRPNAMDTVTGLWKWHLYDTLKKDSMLPFDKIYVLNQKDRPDRLEQFKSEMDRIDGGPYEVVHSIPGEYPAHSFCRSQHLILKMFSETQYKNCLVLEDDVTFQNMVPLMYAMQELPDEWMTLHLGGNATDGVAGMLENQPTAYSQHLVRLRCCWTSQAVAYRRPMAESIVISYDPDTKQMYDDWLSRNVLATNPCFMVRPTVAWQRPGKSDLWGAMTDYTPAWEKTDEKIMAL